MRKFFHRICMAVLLVFLPNIASHAEYFKGKVVNAETGEPLEQVLVQGKQSQFGMTIMNTDDTDSLGCFSVWAEAEGRIVFTYRLIGYKTLNKVDYAYGNTSKDTINLGEIKLQPTALMLQEVRVKAKIPRFTIKGDTIVFNPEAFKLQEGARLADLIRKLPGVQNKNGKLYWNGKPIRLMMNGKNVFGGDAMIGQLPAEVAKKLKVYDHKSELSRHTGKDDGEEDQVLDIQIKPGFLDKWYGNLEANYMTKDHYKAQFETSKLSDHDPQLIFLHANNENSYVDRTIESWWGRNIDKFGKSQYGSYNYQHNWNTQGADKYSNNSWDISASFGHQDGWGEDNASQETFLPNTEHTFSLSRSGNNSHKLIPKLKFNLFAYTDSINSVSVEMEGTYTKQRDTNNYESATYDYDPNGFGYFPIDATMSAMPGDALYEHLITRNRNYTTSEVEKKELNLTYDWKHYFGKKGSFQLYGNTAISGNTSDNHTQRQLEYLREGQSEKLWQYEHDPLHKFMTALYATWEYWLSNKVYLKAQDKLGYTHNSERRTFYEDDNEANLLDGTPTTLRSNNAKHFLLKAWENELTVNATIKPTEAFQILPQAKWNYKREHADLEYGDLDTMAVRHSQSFEPSIQLKWKPSRIYRMDLSFDYKTSTPEMEKTLGYRDDVNPLWITKGNPNLGQSYSHTTKYHFVRMWLRQQASLSIGGSYQKDIHPLTMLYRYDTKTGAYEMMPANIKGGDKYQVDVTFDKGIGVYLHLLNEASFSWQKSYGYLTLLDNQELPELNKQRRFGVTDRLELTYENDNIDLKFFNSISWMRYRYSDASYNSNTIHGRVGMYASIKLSGFNIQNQIYDDYYSGYKMSEMNKHRVIWIAGIGHGFYKNKYYLSLMMDDILNQNRNFKSTYSAYERKENWSKSLHHYLMLSLRYRFDAKANKSKR